MHAIQKQLLPQKDTGKSRDLSLLLEMRFVRRGLVITAEYGVHTAKCSPMRPVQYRVDGTPLAHPSLAAKERQEMLNPVRHRAATGYSTGLLDLAPPAVLGEPRFWLTDNRLRSIHGQTTSPRWP
jgi:hypothetical protein